MAEDPNAAGGGATAAGGGAMAQPPASGRTPTVFVTDASAESSRISDTLRTAGYSVVEVPLSMLVSRAQVQRPHVVLVDVDASGALDEIARLRKLPGGGAIDFVYFGSGDGPIRTADDAMTNEGSAFFGRPVDVGGLVRRMESLTGGPLMRPEARPSTPPPSIPQKRSGTGSVPPPDRSSNPSLPAPGLRTPGPPLPMSTPSLADLVDPPRSLATFGTVSNELQQLLAEAELRAERADVVMPHAAAEHHGPLPTPEEEIETVLPADVLASLDEPLEGDEDEEQDNVRSGGTGPGADRDAMGAHAKGTTAGGSKQTTASGRPASSQPTPYTTHERRVERDRERDRDRDLTPNRRPISDAQQLQQQQQRSNERSAPTPIPPSQAQGPKSGVDTATISLQGLHPSYGLDAATVALSGAQSASDIPTIHRSVSQTSQMGTVGLDVHSPHPPPSRAPAQAAAVVSGIVILRPIDARHFLADAIARRLSGALCFEHDRVVRRLVLRDGDLVTAASGAERESLVCFLGTRGELPRDEVERLAGKVPPYGRHAGAALVAHGWLGQDQLWTALRAHAEWIATSILRLTGGTAQLEAEPPGRLRSEPSVFAACTGAEIFVELVRRAVSPADAIEALGGEGSRIGDGAAQSLLAECALPVAELEVLSRARGGTVGDLLSRAADPEIACVVHALALLGVLDIMAAPAARSSSSSSSSSSRSHSANSQQVTPAPTASAVELEAAALDEEAVRARIRARLELVDEGDYFSVLGVARDATSYEVRRAFVELRRTFEPTRILSPRLLDLADDVRKIVVVLEEAYEILRDVARRERYRRAIDGQI